MQKSVLT